MGARHEDQTKAAVLAALLSGQGVSEVARKYNIPKQTVSQWKHTMLPATSLEELSERTQVRFDELLATYLAETLTTLAAQQRHFRDPEWLKKQPAHELAVLHGVSADKAIRILEAAEAATSGEVNAR
ncbi:MAG: helix-turn-helix domain-containing protein [Acidobacteria bacterium]|nr:helix-turn-helix domain-containing protein [Acidobacteriota bacterium]